MNRDIVRQIVNVVLTLVTIVINALANALPINGQTTGGISDTFSVYFVPAGYVFSIWGLIYLGLIAFTIYQVLPSQRENPRLRRIGYWYALSCLANSAWILAWHYNQVGLSVLIMLVLLASLIAIYWRLEIGRSRLPAVEKWLVQVPFSIYLGWITVATVANITAFLYDIGWNGWGLSDEVWMIIMLIAAGAIAALVALTRRDVAYILVILWAFAGIAIKHSSIPIVSVPTVVVAILVALVLIAVRWRERAQPAAV